MKVPEYCFINVNKILIDLKSLKGSFSCVNKSIAPDKDKGIYFEKAMQDLKELIDNYEKKKVEASKRGKIL